MAITLSQRKFYEAINELEEMTENEVVTSPRIPQDYLNDGDYVVITKSEKYSLNLCTTNLEGFDDRHFLDEKLIYSTFVETYSGETYYIYITQTAEFDEDDAVEFLATQEQIYEYHKQEEQKTVILKMELS
ncbi:TPA: AcrIIA2 family anti-CRISPR protein [Listeria monocytogenes]|uniref:AcrIIA2 family anti-CRISPR protein n=1 Tax=Listeria monocytogenes TaxID=1639 RepID=UPI00176C0A9F|nr:AcrIIA2 family anti-CRISPR protein [Listeria monocytogenes]EHO7462452.1 AcrIIA2 family anti-CRISPR protein [Listeria monocytogenes]ELU6315924.1 AcrIIA2 family anti-CRISPR protein [Listeria monocytogenes]HAB9620636.1 AcrIIA2 family anti-CRISPR protein [Listeria monocytogenes]HDT8353332.1 AcrIIA2 family anti-CRISPR protein [Listeria monocytogenes]